MDLSFSAEEEAFAREVREWLRAQGISRTARVHNL